MRQELGSILVLKMLRHCAFCQIVEGSDCILRLSFREATHVVVFELCTTMLVLVRCLFAASMEVRAAARSQIKYILAYNLLVPGTWI